MQRGYLIIIGIVLALSVLNYYCNGIVINSIWYLSSLPKIIAFTIAILFVMFPRFMENIDLEQYVPPKQVEKIKIRRCK